ncbi:hypothetical protein A4S05_07055 [Nostoc sp. KVJ20]|uniref:hypothetical protein n=1 Tax=Nostoc sp. KVJ20 TaxID=457944 RepID=UPI00083DF615|nr:hypothetical protein [Nostoc sp. KVJ20]ODG98866.1 hypothetical protein A4S05_07055 [Nostoc sp. KVJ20]
MGSNAERLTKLHLQVFGLSDYIIKQIFKNLDAVSTKAGLKEYAIPDVITSVEVRLANPKIQAESRMKLQKVLTFLKEESNVISVDFLKGLSPDKKIEVLRSRIQELESEEQVMNDETSQILTQARKMVAGK